MKLGWRWWMAAALLAMAAQGFSETNALAHPRKWVSASGAELMAIFVEVSGEQVVLKNRQGESIRIPRAKLSTADQTLLDEAFGPVSGDAPKPLPAAEPPAAEPENEAAVAAESASAPAQGPLRVAGSEIPLGQKTTFHVPLDKESVQALKKANNEAAEAVAALWLPSDFDPAKEWSILLVSATADSSSIDHMDCYLKPAEAAKGWILVAADGPAKPVSGDTTQWRWQMARAALLALDAAWPGARRWPIAAGGFSGGAKRSGFLGALLCEDDWNLIGMYMGGCNEDMATEGLKDYRPDRLAFRKVPVYLSVGKKDTMATVMQVNKVRLSLGATGFREVRMETYDGGHNPDAPQITEALNWFKEMGAKRAALK